MKALIQATTFPRWNNDPRPPFVYELCEQLSNQGIDIIVLAPHHRNASFKEVMGDLMVYRFPYFYPGRYQVLCYEGGILDNLKRSHLAKIQVPLLVLSQLYHAISLIRKEKPEIIHSHWMFPSGLVGAICRRTLGTRHLLTLHGADLAVLEKLPFKKMIATFIVRNSDHITIVSSYLQEKLVNLLPSGVAEQMQEKSDIIPMGTHTDLFQREVDVESLRAKYDIHAKFVLLFLGRLSEKKGVQYLLEGTSRLASQNVDIMLLLGGEGPLRKELEQTTEALGLQKIVRFVGFLSGERKLDFFSLCDCLIVPSIVAQSGDTEGMPVVILEGMAAGKPVIASDVGGVKDVVKDGWNGLVIEEKNPDQIATRVFQLMTEDKLRAKLSKNALETAKSYSWHVIGNKYGEIIKKAIEIRRE